MARIDEASPRPVLRPIREPRRPVSGWAALGVFAALLASLVGVSLVEPPGDGPPSMPRGGPASPTPSVAAVSSLPSPVTAPSPAAAHPAPPHATPPPFVGVAVGPARPCPPGERADEPGPVDQARPPTVDLVPMAFDRSTGRIVLLAFAEGAARPETWSFDVCTNTWAPMRPKQEPAVEPWAGAVYDADSHVTIALTASGTPWAYDGLANRWTEKQHPTMIPPGPRIRLLYDARSGSVIAYGSGASGTLAFTAYDAATDAWSELEQTAAPAFDSPGSELFAYDASVDRIVDYKPSYSGSLTRLFDIGRGTWSTAAAGSPVVNFGYFAFGGEIAYDEAHERTVVFSDGQVIAYDASADDWTTVWRNQDPDLGIGPTARLGHGMVYDPINERLVVYGGRYRTGKMDPDRMWVPTDEVIAFDLSTRAWATLLAPSNPSGASSPTRAPTTSQPTGLTAPGSPRVPVARVSLGGEPFFVRATVDADIRRCSGLVVAASTIADGTFLPLGQCWDEGAVWWETPVMTDRWIELELARRYRLDAAIVQADNNDAYRLSYRDQATGKWLPFWTVPPSSVSPGMVTRPDPADDAIRQVLAKAVTTDAVRLEADSGDGMYAVSEIQLFGMPASSPD